MPTKSALITGATGAVGRAMVAVFYKSGYTVIATDRTEKPQDLECEYYLQLDLKLFSESEDYAKQALEKIKNLLPAQQLDVLVNNAAIQILGGVDSLCRNEWKTTMNVNVIAPFLLAQGLITELERGHGGLINIGSIHSRLTKKGFVAYATSKAALAGMTRAMAIDLGPRVRVNAIEPAAVETDMLKAGFEGKQDFFSALRKCHPQERIGAPEEIARLALALVADDLKFLHGACVSIDGGMSARLHDPI